MTLKLADALPLLRTISRQHSGILERLENLISTLKHEPEPVEPTLRAMLLPLWNGLSEMSDIITPPGSTEGSGTSPETE
jgi:hypothetical protein